MVQIKKTKNSRVFQGDVIRDVEHIEYVAEKSGVVEVSKIIYPLVVVLTQDCDLEQDYRFRFSKARYATQDKWLLSVLVAPLYNVEHVFAGEHLVDLGMKMEPINAKRTPGAFLKNNERPRYHYINFPSTVPVVPSVVDFKHYFSVNIKYLKKLKRANFLCQLSSLYREDLSQRFSAYLARIGLPA
ncbi:MAG: hypothetical protein HYY78_18980 [Betaproteobacteria bacterium]|nr:hypothetical protein [Betaproteobacteria bacterium]